jgi:uncharacterized membrane protein
MLILKATLPVFETSLVPYKNHLVKPASVLLEALANITVYEVIFRKLDSPHLIVTFLDVSQQVVEILARNVGVVLIAMQFQFGVRIVYRRSSRTRLIDYQHQQHKRIVS